MLIGYARVSTSEQNLDLQVDALKAACCEKIVTEKESGAVEERQGLTEAINFARRGDVLVVWKLDRLGRSIKHLIKTVAELEERGVGFKSLNEAIDTSTAGGKLVFHIFSALAEFERDLIKTRTRAGLDAARSRGRIGGRPKKVTKETEDIVKSLYRNNSSSVAKICEQIGISRSTFYRITNKLV